MAIISYHVEVTNLLSHAPSLLQAIQDQPQTGPHSNYISIISGPQTISVALFLLSKTSPMLKTILQEYTCLCYEEVSIILPASFSSVLLSLLSLLYTGQASIMNREQVDLLTMLTTELGMSTSFVSDEYHRFEQERVIEGKAYYGGNVQHGRRLGLVGYINDDLMGEDDMYDDMGISSNKATIGTAHKCKKVKFVEDLHNEDKQESVMFMCPPLKPRISMEINVNNRKPIYINEKVKVVAVHDEVVDEDTGGVFNCVSDAYAFDSFCDIENSRFEQGMAEDVVLGSKFPCNICDQVFGRKYDFLDHLASTHYKSRLLNNFERYRNSWPVCEKGTSDIGANMKHIREAHEVVYDYYKADNFGEVGDTNYNEVKRHAKKSHADLTVNSKRKKVGERTRIASVSPIKGILKLNHSNSKEAPKSILRTPRQKSSLSYQSILKLPKSPLISKQKSIVRGDQVESDDRDSRRVLLSVQDEVGEMIIDLE